MKTKQLTMFSRQHCNGVPCNSYTLAAWHWKWSLTWRWIATWTPQRAGRIGPYFMRVYRGRGFNFYCGLNLPLIGSFSIQTQPNMPLTPNEQGVGPAAGGGRSHTTDGLCPGTGEK